MASSIDLQRLDLVSGVPESGGMPAVEHFAIGKAAISNAARRPLAGASELAARHSLGAVCLSWSGMRV